MGSPDQSRPSRVGLVHAVVPAVAPIHEAFARHWPEASLFDVADYDLPELLQAEGGETQRVGERILRLASRAAEGADAVLFTCTAFDASIDAAKPLLRVPLWKPNEAMFDEGLAHGTWLGFIATFQPAVAPMEAGLRARAAACGRTVTISTICVPEAMAAARAGDIAKHDALVALAVPLLHDCDAIMLAQFSTSTALMPAQAATSKPVLCAPDSAVRALRRTT